MRKFLVLMGLMAFMFAVSMTPALANEGDVDQLFEQLDANKDGKLSQSEFAAHPDLTVEMFAKWDADGDQQISKDEFVANFDK